MVSFNYLRLCFLDVVAAELTANSPAVERSIVYILIDILGNQIRNV